MDSPTPFRVAVFCDCQNRGGVFTYTCRLGRELRRRGMRVELFTWQPRTGGAEDVLEELRAAADDVCVLDGDRPPAALIAALGQALVRRGVRLFVPNYRGLTYAACAAVSRAHDLKVVGVCHSDDASSYGLLRHYRGIIHGYACPSQKTFATLRRLLPDRTADVRLVPHGVPVPDQPAPAYAGGPLHLVYHGRLEEEPKNVSALIHLARLLRDRGVPAVLRLVGSGSWADRYRALAAEFGLGERVVFIGECGWEQLAGVFQKSHLAVLSSRFEGFCLSLAEAMAAGLPAVAFACGGVIEEYLRDGTNGFLVPFGDVAAMTDRAACFYQNPTRWAEFSAAARGAIRQRYSLDAFGERYLTFFGEVARSPQRLRWPRLRPSYLTPGRGGMRAVVERVGQLVGAWG